MRQWFGTLLLLIASNAAAGEWAFGEKVPVSPHFGKGVFHQLDATGRKHIAASADKVVVLWTDNHEGSSNVYAAFKSAQAPSFRSPIKLNKRAPAFSPAVVGLADGFLFGHHDFRHQLGAGQYKGKRPGQGFSHHAVGRI